MKRRTGVVVLTVLGMLLSLGHLEAQTESVDVIPFGGGAPTGGTSHLTRTGDILIGVIEAVGLVPGDAHTVWWVIFNNPGFCGTTPCGLADLGNPMVNAGLGNTTGNVAKADGTAEFGGRVTKDVVNDHQVLKPAMGAFGDAGPILVVDPADAEVHFIVQTHGQGRGGKQLLGQLTTVNTNCTPACADVRAAIHLP